MNRFIEDLYRRIKREKPRVQLGISPFGIWRPGHPADIQGMDQYEVLYADARLWLEKGWVDYLVPQLYWPIAKVGQSYPVLLGWWQRQNRMGRHLWPGLYTSRVGDGTAAEYGMEEVLGQVMVARGMLQEDAGVVHFSAKLFMSESGRELVAALKGGPYASLALPPISPWLDVGVPGKPRVVTRSEPEGLRVLWEPGSGRGEVAYWVLHIGSGTGGRCLIYGSGQRECLFEGKAKGRAAQGGRIALHAVDRMGNLSAPVEVWLVESAEGER